MHHLVTLHTINRVYIVATFAFTILVVSVGTFSAYGSSSPPDTFLKGSTPYGVPYEDWMTKWWQWNIQIPTEEHPQLLGSALKQCPVGDLGNVSFIIVDIGQDNEVAGYQALVGGGISS